MVQQESLADAVRSNMAEVMMVRDEMSDLRNHSEQLNLELFTEKRRRLEEKRRLVERSASYANTMAQKRLRHISLGIAVVAVGLAFAGTEFRTRYGIWISAIGSIFSGILTFVTFWKIPDMIFGAHLAKVRECAFQLKIAEYQLDGDLEHFVVDWDTGQVSVKPLGD